jgi:hypothetical protein
LKHDGLCLWEKRRREGWLESFVLDYCVTGLEVCVLLRCGRRKNGGRVKRAARENASSRRRQHENDAFLLMEQ